MAQVRTHRRVQRDGLEHIAVTPERIARKGVLVVGHPWNLRAPAVEIGDHEDFAERERHPHAQLVGRGRRLPQPCVATMCLGQILFGQPIGEDLFDVRQQQRDRRARRIQLLVEPLRVAQRLHPRDFRPGWTEAGLRQESRRFSFADCSRWRWLRRRGAGRRAGRTASAATSAASGQHDAAREQQQACPASLFR